MGARRAPGRCAVVPLFRADVQWTPDPLRPPLCDGGGGVSGARGTWSADRHAAGGTGAVEVARGGGHTFRVSGREPDFRYRGLLGLRKARGRWKDHSAVGEEFERRAGDVRGSKNYLLEVNSVKLSEY